MSPSLAMESPAPHDRDLRKRKIAFVADQFAPPVFDGSTFVYKNWIDFLSEHYALYAILFDSYGGDAAPAQRYLAERCAAHLILPGASRSRLWKLLRATSRLATGTVFAPQWIEELGRGRIHAIIADFISRHDLRLFLVSKLASVPLLGERNLRREDATFFLDAHDDFIARERQDREALRALFRRFPALRRYPRFRDMRLRQLLSRLEPRRARAQEARLCALFDCLLTSSRAEHTLYEAILGARLPCVHLGWPAPEPSQDAPPAARAAAAFDVGFIGGDYPFNLEGVLFFCTEVLPLIRRSRPAFRLLIAGNIARPLVHIGSQWPGVEICGYLPDARSFYDRVAAVVVPLLSGTGASIKTLDGLAHGKPVVSTRVGARGISDRTVHPELFIADEPADFADKVLALYARSDALPSRGANRSDSFCADFAELLHRYAGAEERFITCSG
jgi:glycosyltransferase involved in cell wall biosynthesis